MQKKGEISVRGVGVLNTHTCCQGLEKGGVRHVLRASKFPVLIALACPDPFPRTGFVDPEQWVVSEHRHPLSPASEKSHLSPGRRGF